MSILKDWWQAQDEIRREADSAGVEYYHGDGTVEDPFEHLLESMGFSVVDPAKALQQEAL